MKRELQPRIHTFQMRGGSNAQPILDPKYLNYLVRHKDYLTWGTRTSYHLIESINVSEKTVTVKARNDVSDDRLIKLTIDPGSFKSPYLSGPDYARITRKIKVEKIKEIINE